MTGCGPVGGNRLATGYTGTRKWEPACGPGRMVNVLRAAGHEVLAPGRLPPPEKNIGRISQRFAHFSQ